jgi:HAD superfamily hydrolase (TIGR01549 family)
MKPNAAVLLDIDGTLVDSTYHHALAWHRAFSRVGEAPAMWRIHRSVGMGGDKLVAAAAGQDVEERHGDELRDAWREEYAKIRSEVRPLPGAADLVRALSDVGIRVALASSGDPAFAREAVDLLGIGDLVEVLTTAEDADGSKPEPDLIAVTLDRMGGVERAVFVGDTSYDVQAAGRAGMGCLALLTGGFGAAELTDAGASMVAESPAELIGIDWPSSLSELSR